MLFLVRFVIWAGEAQKLAGAVLKRRPGLVQIDGVAGQVHFSETASNFNDSEMKGQVYIEFLQFASTQSVLGRGQKAQGQWA